MAPRFSSRALLKWAALALPAWLLLAGLAASALIKMAYEGKGPAFLNNLIGGQSTLTVTGPCNLSWQ